MAASTGKMAGLILLILFALFIFMYIGSFFLGLSHFGGFRTGGMEMLGPGPVMRFFPFLPIGILVLWLVTVFWVYHDAEHRNMNGLLWGLLVFVGNFIGLLIYLIVRNEAIPLGQPASPTVATTPCPSCGSQVQEEFAFCPHCGSKMKATCPACDKPVAADWQVCPYCGGKLTEETPGVEK